MRTYPGMSYQFVMDDLPMAQGWAMHTWAIENDGWLQFNGNKPSSKRYVAQEIDKLMTMVN